MMMFRYISRASVFLFLITCLSVGLAFSAGAPKKEEDSERKGGVPYKLTVPAIRSTLPKDILDKMRKNLMVYMGIELEQETKKPETGGH